ncbi:hypothetical protein OIU84_001486 [Salix udensis]|uniref:Uncharacterized protein n=1 Tax=Salix udensis TaxID=889485 RepID=A0AAD6P6X1_9ROSI|nr:hypothetical protein OIU84_001486 [Salix udensis]
MYSTNFSPSGDGNGHSKELVGFTICARLSSRFDRRRDDLERGKTRDGLLALEDLVGLMEAGGGEEKLHDLKENLSLSDILINVGLSKPRTWKVKNSYSSICKPVVSYGIPYSLYAVSIMPVSSIV